ncbi:nuclear transport factor 2 family protein [Rhodanobacter spathiphylli]|uniref:SnoaL-like domain-containing protein n=1 Tax=Rhodanobacter spathiphylli B39 TaxID=1163407 RepID=I4W7B8_9GAMM|nr:nuclear transport factor 2 family protein [Rhodanobacter spathiphylli]EIL95359.1 hypothetical protein UU7_00430 [Rhodanobacter spathiphylli B39]
MAISLPHVIAVFFQVSNGLETASLADCFMQDATVLDEGEMHQGHEAIQLWQREAQRKYQYSVDPSSVSRQGDCVTVSAAVVGNFPGSPVQLDHVFNLVGDKIQSLEIG